MKKTVTTAGVSFGSFTNVWKAVKANPEAYAGKTIRVTVSPDDLQAWLEATGINLDTFTIDGNRPENTTNAKDLLRNCPTFEAYDPDLGRVVICGLGTTRTCAGDGGHRSRMIVRFTQDGQSGVVDVLFTTRSANMGGFDQTGKKRDSSDELRVMQNEEWGEWSSWQSTTGQLIRLRRASKSVKGGGKSGETWNGVILTPHQSATQWQDGTLNEPIHKIAFAKNGNTMKSLCQIFESWKESGNKAWGNDQYRIFGIIVVACFDLLGAKFDEQIGDLIDKLDAEADKVAKKWEAWRSITQPKADIEQDYPAWLQLLEAVRDGKNLPTLKKDYPVTTKGIYEYFETQEKTETETETEE